MSSFQIRWQCRRGMLELDLLLMPFVDKSYDSLLEQQKLDFIELLTYSDQELLDWFMGKSEPKSPQLRLMVQLIREQHWKE